MKVLIIDNHDSFTYNLSQLAATVGWPPPQAGHVRRMTADVPFMSPKPTTAYRACSACRNLVHDRVALAQALAGP